METSYLSQLPEWIIHRVVPGQKRSMIGIQCPRHNCGCKALVNGHKWLTAGGDTRACTYCFKAAWLPGRKPKPKPRER